MRELTRPRNAVDLASSVKLRITRAADQHEFEAAFRCLYESYRKRGLAAAHPTQLRLTRHHLLPASRVFLAKVGTKVVGTLSLAPDAPIGVPMRSVFNDAVQRLTQQTPCVAEATCLAVRDAPVNSLTIVHRLMGLAAQSARRQGVSRILIAVHPRHVPFYERSAGFRTFAPCTPYPSVGGSPAVGLQLNLATLHVDFPAVHRRYFGMIFSPAALSNEPTPMSAVQRLAAIWRDIHGASGESRRDMPATLNLQGMEHTTDSAVADRGAVQPYGMEGLYRQGA
jgi:hypothetical protein